HHITCAVRRKHSDEFDKNHLFDQVRYFDTLNGKTDFGKTLKDIDVVIHLAARAHIITKSVHDRHNEFLDINFHGTRNLAEQAVKSGVKRFVFISSIGVNGKSTKNGMAYTEADVENPHNSYSVSKLKAEQALKKLEANTNMEVVIIRSPLVYGPDVKANFLRLLNLVNTGLPLPFAGIKNKRSFIAIDNLVDAIAECAVHAKAGGETFIVSDDQALSIPQLLKKISNVMGRNPRLFYFPVPVFKALLTLSGKQEIYERLWGSLIVDSGKIRRQIGWRPKVSVDEGIQKTVQWYLKKNVVK
ncbi:NAD-dependent epimerase/dehydratase family protein, partial [Desulfobacula sp.]|uniref:NAD-dependent epimerase/dehydratase family protein n=1 Tax=Desulfobacula sp. TaxID=2593537 RepID=UPI0025BCA4A5